MCSERTLHFDTQSKRRRPSRGQLVATQKYVSKKRKDTGLDVRFELSLRSFFGNSWKRVCVCEVDTNAREESKVKQKRHTVYTQGCRCSKCSSFPFFNPSLLSFPSLLFCLKLRTTLQPGYHTHTFLATFPLPPPPQCFIFSLSLRWCTERIKTRPKSLTLSLTLS